VERLSVVVPAYREAARLPRSLERLPKELDDAGRAPPGFALQEIVVVDDGSDDDTSAVVRRAAETDARIRLLRFDPNGGKGRAVREGARAAAGDWILVTDADLSTPPADVRVLLAAARAGAPVAIGSRRVPGARVEVRQPFHREVLGLLFRGLRHLLVLGGIRDTQCGFKLFRADAARALFAEAREDGFVYDVEVLWLARRRGIAVAEVPVRWSDDPRSQVAAVPASLSMFAGLLRLALRRLLRR
jgi:dolichyl-phosphate beta-glucosyltransferase